MLHGSGVAVAWCKNALHCQCWFSSQDFQDAEENYFQEYAKWISH
jgi:hypothetical protein